jgi:electron-transferring-flavoprotein dehydrogenase
MSSRMTYDILLVGGSPSNLILAHHLVDLAAESKQPISMAILEKGKEFGAHIMSGAVSNPHVLKKVFPNIEETDFPIEGKCDESYFKVLGNKKGWDVPAAVLPEGLHKQGYYILTLSHVVAWLAKTLQEKLATVPHVSIDFFTGFAAHAVVYEPDASGKEKVAGVQVVETPTGVPEEDNLYAKVTVFGDKGFVSKDVIEKYNLRKNPQVWSVGVKEVWQVSEDYTGKVWHTMGYPLVDGTFGGGFVYGMKNNRMTIGLVISLDAQNPNINPQQRLQDYKKHPWLQAMLKDGKLLKYGAAVLPEGGLYSLPSQFAVEGAMFLGDALGTLTIHNLAGIDKAMESGYIAAEVLHEGLVNKNLGYGQLAHYQQRLMDGFVGEDLRYGRYFRHAWTENPRLLNVYLPEVMAGIDNGAPVMGVLSAGLKHNPLQAMCDALKLKRRLDGCNMGEITYKPDHTHINPAFRSARQIRVGDFDKATVYSREDAVFYANPKYHEGNEHIDEFNADTCVKCINVYETQGKTTPCVSDCTAEVHRVDLVAGIRKHGMSLENCVQCRTCEIVCPEVNLRVNAAAQGSGPDFMGL